MARPRTGSLYLAKSGWRARITTDGGRQTAIPLGTFDKAEAERRRDSLVVGRPLPSGDTAERRFLVAETTGVECVDSDGLSPDEFRRFALLAAKRGWTLIAARAP